MRALTLALLVLALWGCEHRGAPMPPPAPSCDELGVRPSDVALDEARFPEHGRALIRNNYPADQFWGLDGGDDLAAVIAEAVDYWDAAE